jgi:hypothetical protein
VFVDSDLPEEVTGRAGKALPFRPLKKEKTNKKEQGYQGSQNQFFNRESIHDSYEIGSLVSAKILTSSDRGSSVRYIK